jgi:hypothetical protein
LGTLVFRFRPAIGSQGAPDVNLLVELALFVAPHVTLIARGGSIRVRLVVLDFVFAGII